MFGCNNDIISWNRDFCGNFVGVIDVQEVHKQMAINLCNALKCKEKIGTLYQRFPTWTKKIYGFDPMSNYNPMQEIEFKQKSTSKISLSDITKIYLNDNISISTVATHADWRIRPLCDNDMIAYALSDVNLLIRIWQRMKKLVIINFYKFCFILLLTN
jgi:hypothetical protein